MEQKSPIQQSPITAEKSRFCAAHPEPSTLLLLAIGTLGVIGWAWRRRGQTA